MLDVGAERIGDLLGAQLVALLLYASVEPRIPVMLAAVVIGVLASIEAFRIPRNYRLALELYDVRVVFGDGSTYSPATRLVFAPGSTSRVIDLPGGARVIRRVEFRYGNLPGGGRAQVEVWGI